MEHKNKLITILVPCFNEEEMLPLFYKEVCGVIDTMSNYRWELLLVNDGSHDNTKAIVELMRKADKRISFISLSRNFGKEAAMLSGLDYSKGDAVIVMDADLQDPPSLIPEMLKCWEEGYDDVYCKRKSRGRESWIKKRLSLAYYRLLQKMTRFDILPNVGDFRLLDRKCVDALIRLRETERYTKGLFAWIGFKKKELLFDRDNRQKGRSAWSFSLLFNLAIEGITSFSMVPLRFSSILGLIVSVFAFIYMGITFVKALIWGDPVAGYPSLMIIILFLGGVQLLSIGLVGEYLGKIFNESKNRPPYIVEKYESDYDSSDKV